MDSRKLLTVKEVADCLHIGRNTVYRMAKRRWLPAYKIGRHWRFDLATIQNLSSSQQQIPSDKRGGPGMIDQVEHDEARRDPAFEAVERFKPILRASDSIA